MKSLNKHYHDIYQAWVSTSDAFFTSWLVTTSCLERSTVHNVQWVVDAITDAFFRGLSLKHFLLKLPFYVSA